MDNECLTFPFRILKKCSLLMRILNYCFVFLIYVFLTRALDGIDKTFETTCNKALNLDFSGVFGGYEFSYFLHFKCFFYLPYTCYLSQSLSDAPVLLSSDHYYFYLFEQLQKFFFKFFIFYFHSSKKYFDYII